MEPHPRAAMPRGRPSRPVRVSLVDGIHDLGGMQGFGRIDHSTAEPAFHERWEAAARALLILVADAVNASGGEFRHSIERMAPGHYLTSSYYEHWVTAAATLAVEHGLVRGDELEERPGGSFPLSGPVIGPPMHARPARTGESLGSSRRPGQGARLAPARAHALSSLCSGQSRDGGPVRRRLLGAGYRGAQFGQAVRADLFSPVRRGRAVERRPGRCAGTR